MDDEGEARVVQAHHGREGTDLADELVALRARLREVEAMLGLPARPGRPSPPPLGAVLARVAALERRAGIVPGLLPLSGSDSAVAVATITPAVPRSRRQVWLDRGQVLLAAGLVIALCTWLLRPLPPSGHPRPPAAQPTAPATVRINPYWVYTEDVAIDGNPATVAYPFVSDQFTYEEDLRSPAPNNRPCVDASAAGIPGEGCTP